MRISKKIAAMALTASFCMTAVLSGCGGQDGETTAAVTEAPTAAVTAGAETAAVTTGAETTAAESQFQAVDETVYVTSRVNVRVEPNTSCESLAVLEVGESVHRIGYNETWSQVEYNGGVHYIASQYLSTDPAAATAPAETSAGSISVGEAPSVSQGVDWSTGAAFEGDAASLPNDAIPYGYQKQDRDAYNRPNGVFYYETYYGYYGDFVGPNSNTIYLTMDEGYEAGYTPTILDTLKEKNVKATFFITKQFFDSDPELVQRMIDEGHTIGNHTCSHPSGGIQQLGIQGETDDIMKLHNLVKDKFGYEMTLFRFPEGTFSEQSLKVVNDLGYRPIFWSYAHDDYHLDAQPDPAESLQDCLNSLHPGAIYLLHAVSATNTEILGDFIDGARAKGYDFAAVPSNGL